MQDCRISPSLWQNLVKLKVCEQNYHLILSIEILIFADNFCDISINIYAQSLIRIVRRIGDSIWDNDSDDILINLTFYTVFVRIELLFALSKNLCWCLNYHCLRSNDICISVKFIRTCEEELNIISQKVIPIRYFQLTFPHPRQETTMKFVERIMKILRIVSKLE